MGRNIRGITIEFGADTGKLNKAFSDLKNESTKITRRFKDIDKLLKFNPKNVELLSQKQKALAERIKNTSERLKVLKDLQADMKARGIDENSDQFQALRREIIDTEQALKNYKSSMGDLERTLSINSSKLGKVGLGLQEAGAKMQQYGEKVKKVGDGIHSVGNKMTIGITLPILAAGKAMYDAGSSFEAGMSEVKAISNASAEDMEKLNKVAKEMGRTTKYSATESASALKYMAMAGWDTNQMIAGLPGVMNLAAASGEDLALVSDIVTDALSGFKMEAKDASKFADLLASTSSNANTNVSLLGESFKYVAPVAGALGYSAEDTALALGLMANAGIKGSNAGTALRSTMTRLVKPTEESGKAMEELGIQVTDSEGKMKPFGELIKDMRSKFQNLTEEQQAQYGAMIAGERGMSGFLAIMNAGEKDFNKLSKATKNYTGEAKRMSDEMENNTKGKITKLKSALEGLAIDGFKALLPSLEKLIGKMQKGVEWFSKLDQKTKDNIVQTAALVAAIGPVLSIAGKVISVGGSLIKTVGFVTKGVGTLSTFIAGSGGITGALSAAGSSLAGFATAIGSFLISPVGLGIAAVAALGYGFYRLNKHMSQDSIPAMNLFGEGVSDATAKAVTSFVELEQEGTNSLNRLVWSGQTVTKEGGDAIVASFTSMKEQIVQKLNEQKDESIEVLTKMFAESKNLTDEEKAKMLKSLEEKNLAKIQKTQEAEERVKEIMQAAIDEKRTLTQEEVQEITFLKEDMKKEGIRVLTESEEEYRIIMQRMADQGAEISARGAVDVVKSSLEQKEKTVENANKEYEDRIRVAEQIRAEGGEEAEAAANKIIEEAQRQRDESIASVEEMHQKVIEQAKLQAGEHAHEVDWEAAEIKNKWLVMKENIDTKTQEIEDRINEKWEVIKRSTAKNWSEAGENLKGAVAQMAENTRQEWSQMVRDASEKWNELKENIKRPIIEAKNWLDRKVAAFKNAFNFSWRLPRFRLPTVHVYRARGAFGIPIPRFNVTWNKKGGIFKIPTVIPTLAGLQGFAEPSTGGEAIMPLEKLPDLMASAMEKVRGSGTQTIINYITLDGKVIGKEVTNFVEGNLSTKISRTRLAGGLV